MLGDVNVASLTIASGAITLAGSLTGSGVYTIECESGVTGDQLTTINGGSGYAVITLRPGTVGEYFVLVHDGSHIILQEDQNFTPQSINDCITLRDRDGDGSVWVEMIPRLRFPV